MKIELKNVKIADSLSEETIAFTGVLYIDGKKVGVCHNRGNGGDNMIQADYSEDKSIFRANLKAIQDAEAYCKTLPPEKSDFGGGDLPMDLDFFISLAVGKIAEEKDIQKFKKKMEKDMDKGVLVGSELEYCILKSGKKTISQIVSDEKGILWLNDQLNKLSSKLKPGERILNTNFPASVIIPEPVKA